MSIADPGTRRLADEAEAARDEIAGKVGAAAGKARELGDDTAELAGIASDLAGTAFKQSRHLLDAARVQATGFADERKNDAAQSIADIASSLRESGKGFEGRPNITAFMGGAADGLEQLAGSIRDRTFAELYSEAETFARRQPLAVAIATAAAGFFLARFIKSSSEELSKANSARTASRRAAAA